MKSEIRPLLHSCCEWKMVQRLWKTACQHFTKLNIVLAYDLVIVLLDICQIDFKTYDQAKVCAKMFFKTLSSPKTGNKMTLPCHLCLLSLCTHVGAQCLALGQVSTTFLSLSFLLGPLPCAALVGWEGAHTGWFWGHWAGTAALTAF